MIPQRISSKMQHLTQNSFSETPSWVMYVYKYRYVGVCVPFPVPRSGIRERARDLYVDWRRSIPDQFVLKSNKRNERVPIRRFLSDQKTDLLTILFQAVPRDPRPETRNQWTINNDVSTFWMCAPAPQIHFRLTPLLTSKPTRALNHATSGPQASFVVAPWHLRKTSGVPDSAGFRGEGREAQPKFEKLLEAISCGEITASNRGQSVKRNGRTTVQSGMPVRAELFWEEKRSIWKYRGGEDGHDEPTQHSTRVIACSCRTFRFAYSQAMALKMSTRGGRAKQNNKTINLRDCHTTTNEPRETQLLQRNDNAS